VRPRKLRSTTRAASSANGEQLDALIDEIDGLLEENAAEFVDSYIQRGGQ
jgi:ubiquitin-like protein Pup